ncbi:MAG: dihydrofolate reductase family protein [Acidimicrobiia bacterium]
MDELYRSPDRPLPDAVGGRPWIVSSIITTIDGAVALNGTSGALGSDGDRAVFSALRSMADVVLVGAGTVTAERYRPPRRPDQRIAVVTRRADVSGYRELMDSGRAVLVTTMSSPESGYESIRAGVDEVDLTEAVRLLSERYGARWIGCEGGPSLNAAMIEADLVDEYCWTIAPMLLGHGEPASASTNVAATAHMTGRSMRLAHLAEQDGYLFARYLRSR